MFFIIIFPPFSYSTILYALQETYPSTPPVWFAESEDTSISNAVQILTNTKGLDNHVINQVSWEHLMQSNPSYGKDMERINFNVIFFPRTR